MFDKYDEMIKRERKKWLCERKKWYNEIEKKFDVKSCKGLANKYWFILAAIFLSLVSLPFWVPTNILRIIGNIFPLIGLCLSLLALLLLLLLFYRNR
jgi:hypothetical protein